MTSTKRKLKRAQEKKMKKQLKEAASSYLDLPEQCLTCDKLFDKTSREHVTTWNIVIRKAEGKKNLYCPECWDGAKKLLKDIQKDLLKKQEQE